MDIENQKMANNEQQLESLKAARDEYLKEHPIDSMIPMSDEWNNWVQMESDIRATTLAIQDNQKAIEEYKQQIKDLYLNYFEEFEQAFGRLEDLFERRGNYIEKSIDILQESGQQVTRGYYDALIANTNDSIAASQEHLARAEQNLADGLASGAIEEGSEEWWDLKTEIYDASAAIQDGELAIIQYKNAIKDLYIEGFSKIEKGFANISSLFNDQKSYIEKYNQLLELQGEVVTEDSYNQMLEIENQNLQNNQAALSALLAARDEAMMNGDIQAGSEEWVDMESKIRAAEAAVLDSQIAVEELNKSIKQLYVDAFEKISKAFGNKNDILSSQQDYINGYIDRLEILGVDVPQEVYDKLIEVEQQKRADNVDNLVQAREHIADLESKGLTAADEEWVNATKNAIELEKAIQENDNAILEWQKTINEMDFTKFDDFMNRLGNVKSEMENIKDIMSHDDVAFEDGTWTKEGLTSLAMLYQQMELAKAQSQEYADEIDKLNQLYDSGALSEKDYYERMQALKDGQWDAIKTVEDLKDSIVDLNSARIDMIEKGINKEIKAMSDLIEMKNKELDAERDLYEFKKSTEKQTKNIAEIQRKLASLSGSTAASDIAELRKLRAQLTEAQEELNDSYYNRAKDQQSKALSDENELFSKIRTDLLEDMREKLEDIDAVVTESMNNLLANADVVLGSLNDISTKYGVNISSNLINPWKEASDEAIAFKQTIKDSLGTLINEDGIITAFGLDTTRVLGNIDDSLKNTGLFATELSDFMTSAAGNIGNSFNNTGLLATKFSDAVAQSVSDIERAIGSQNSGFTQKLDRYLKYPWEDTTASDGPIATFCKEVISALDEAVNKAKTDYATMMQTSLEQPWNEASLETFNTKVLTALQTAVSDIETNYNNIKNPLEQPMADAKTDLFSDKVANTLRTAIADIEGAYNEFANGLSRPWENTSFLDTFANQVERALDKAVSYVNNAANNINNTFNNIISNAQSISNNISNLGTIKTTILPTTTTLPTTETTTTSNNSYNDKVAQLQQFLIDYWAAGGMVGWPDGIYDSRTEYAVRKMQSAMNNYFAREDADISITVDGKYGSETVKALNQYYNLMTVTEGSDQYLRRKSNIPPAYYAKGTMATTHDQLAITDEPQWGDELTLVPNKAGNLSFLRKGTGVVPADMTQRLWELAQMPTSELGSTIIKAIVPNVATNNNYSQLTFDSLVHIDNCTEETIPQVKKIINESLDKFVRQMNYSLKKVGAY